MRKKNQERLVLRRGVSEPVWRSASADGPAADNLDFDGIAGAARGDTRAARRPSPWWRRLMAAAVLLMTLSLVALAVHGSVKGFRTSGASMQPTLEDGDGMIVNGFAYAQVDFGMLDWLPLIDPSGRWSTPERGDVIVFDSPVTEGELVKRVVGLPGEQVEIADGMVNVNGDRLAEPYITVITSCTGPCSWVVPDRHYFVLGDNRGDSRDSREGWMIPIEDMAGKKLFSY